MNSRTAPKNTAQRTLGIGSELFGFHFEICLQTTLDTPAPRHHGAVEGFFTAPQERADYTSFEGGKKWRVGGGLLYFRCAHMPKFDNGVGGERSDVDGNAKR